MAELAALGGRFLCQDRTMRSSRRSLLLASGATALATLSRPAWPASLSRAAAPSVQGLWRGRRPRHHRPPDRAAAERAARPAVRHREQAGRRGAPRGTPAEAIETLNKAVNAALNDPAFKAQFADLGGTPLCGPPDAFGGLIAADTEKMAKVIRVANITVESPTSLWSSEYESQRRGSGAAGHVVPHGCARSLLGVNGGRAAIDSRPSGQRRSKRR